MYLLWTKYSTVETVFKSVHHPNGSPRGLVYAKALVGPLGASTVPVMIGATVAALQGQTVWEFLIGGFPAALIVAFVWTHFALSSTIAEVHLKPGKCALQSIRDVVQNAPREWHPLYNVKVTPSHLELALGWKTRECSRKDWPKYEQLRRAAQRALDARTHGPSTVE